MRLLYVAPDQVVPGTLGGSIHVRSVAEGLAARGHEVHVAATPAGEWPAGRVTWHALPPPFGRSHLRAWHTGAIERLARRVGAELVMERYHNFGGEGVVSAARLQIPAVLEVNAPIVDYPGSPKRRLDRLLLAEPMRRWRDRLCRLTALFVTPSAEILPVWIDRRRILETEWGADTKRFHPEPTEGRGQRAKGEGQRAEGKGQRAEGRGDPPYVRPADRVVCVFAGAFRAWHGAVRLAEALARLHASGDHRFAGVFIGDGPERAATERAAAGVPGVIFTGAIRHEDMPRALAAADIGVAPFDPSRHRALELGFFWSPLKVFEYMASGLPVVAPSLARLGQIVEPDREGLLYDPADPRGLDRAIVALADVDLRRRLGHAGRARAIADFSWEAHVAALDARLIALVRP